MLTWLRKMRSAELLGTGGFVLLMALMAVPRDPAKEAQGATGPAWTKPSVSRDLSDVQKDTLRILVLRDPLTWEVRPGAMTGLEWELLERFAKRLHLPVLAVPVSDPDSMLAMLQNGRGDIIAAQLSPSGWAAPYVACTQSYRRVASARAVTRMVGVDPPTETTFANSDTLLVSRWSPFLDTLGRLTVGDTTWVARITPETPQQLLDSVAIGRQNDILVSDACGSLEAKRLPLIQFKARVGRSVPLVFGVRTNSEHLLHALDTWLALAPEYEARKAMIAAYDNGLDTRGPIRSFTSVAAGSDAISPYDSLFQAHSDSLSWDWKLLAAVAFKESSFDTAAVSYMGAGGLMQMMPATAALMGVTAESGLDGHIQGASRYLGKLDAIWRSEIPSPSQRLKFVLAAYNAGPGHVKDAQRLAKQLGLDPDRWDNNVDRAIVLLNRPAFYTLPLARSGYCRGQDTYWYVRDVVTLFAWMRGKDLR
ncbi:MAG: transglycosylase SLT domain-containing protein [Flavobacteriales bacterium]